MAIGTATIGDPPAFWTSVGRLTLAITFVALVDPIPRESAIPGLEVPVAVPGKK
jgi:hypothetical protein